MKGHTMPIRTYRFGDDAGLEEILKSQGLEWTREDVELKSIDQTNTGFQTRSDVDFKGEVASDYQRDMFEKGHVFPPILLAKEGDMYATVGGKHREVALNAAGVDVAENVIVVDLNTENAGVHLARTRALEAVSILDNMRHGRRDSEERLKDLLAKAIVEENGGPAKGEPSNTVFRDVGKRFGYLNATRTKEAVGQRVFVILMDRYSATKGLPPICGTRSPGVKEALWKIKPFPGFDDLLRFLVSCEKLPIGTKGILEAAVPNNASIESVIKELQEKQGDSKSSPSKAEVFRLRLSTPMKQLEQMLEAGRCTSKEAEILDACESKIVTLLRAVKKLCKVEV